jgi:hypothetical protein
MTEALAQLEGLERGPAGNTSLTAAFAIAQTLPEEAVVVVNETEYTGAGKHPYAQLAFAERMGVEVRRGDPEEERPGSVLVIPAQPRQTASLRWTGRLRHILGEEACAALGEDKTVSKWTWPFFRDTPFRRRRSRVLRKTASRFDCIEGTPSVPGPGSALFYRTECVRKTQCISRCRSVFVFGPALSTLLKNRENEE